MASPPRAEVLPERDPCRLEASTGDVGHGMHENFIVGIYRLPASTPGTMAP